MAWDQTMVLVCVVSDTANANNLIAMIYGDPPETDNEVATPLSFSGEGPATHYGSNAMMSEEMVTGLLGIKAGAFGGCPLATYGLSEASAQAVANAMTIEQNPDGGFAVVVEEQGLNVIEPDIG